MLQRTVLLFALAVAHGADPIADCESTDDTVSLLQSPTEVHLKADTQLLQQPDAPTSTSTTDTGINMKAFLAEFIAMTLFVIIGVGTAMAVAKEPGWLLQVSLAFGLAITSLAYAIGHYSGAHINCAVTLGLVINGNTTPAQGGMNLLGQLLGSILGSFILHAIYDEDRDKTGGLGCNSVNDNFPYGNLASDGLEQKPKDGLEKNNLSMRALIGEFAMTFLLMFVVLETAVNPAAAANSALAPLAIGLAVFLAHCVLIPIDGCSINPTRSFGPLLINRMFYKKKCNLADQWIFWVGPLIGATAAAYVNKALMK
jgi:MIP family channel proteins